MDVAVLFGIVSFLSVAAIAACCVRWQVVQNREMFWSITKQALTTRRDLIVGIAALVMYLLVYLVLGNHVHWFYGRLIFTLTAWTAIVAMVSAILVGVLFAVFSYNWRTLGLSKGKTGAWGVLGTMFALVISFCP